MKKRLALVLAAVVVVVAGVCGWHWRHAGNDGTLTLYGNVDIRQVSLAFDGNDRIAQMYVEEGDRVTAGEVLARLDTRTLELELAQAKAQVEVFEQSLLALRHGSRPEEIAQADARVVAAKAEVERSRLQWQRLQSAFTQTEGRAVGRQELDNAHAQFRAAQAQQDVQQQAQRLAKIGPRQEDIARAEAQWQGAQADQALLQHRIDLSVLRAPQAAVVRSRLLEPGDMASPQKPVYTLALTDPKWIRAYVSEPQLGRLRPDMAVTVTTDSAPGKPIQGRLGFISSVAEFTPKNVQTEELRTDLVYEVRIWVKDPNDVLRLGMPATVHIDLTPAPADGAAHS